MSKDWNSFRTIGEETGRYKQPVTWVHYVLMLVFWPVAVPFGIFFALAAVSGRFGSFGALGLGYRLSSRSGSLGDWLPFLILAGIGLVVGIAMCIHMYRGEQQKKTAREIEEKRAAEAVNDPGAPPQDSRRRESGSVTGTSEAADERERTIAAMRRRS